MSEVTVSPPSIGLQAYFSFKEPVATYVRSKMNSSQLSFKFVVSSIFSLREMIELELRDPFSEIYNLLGISDYDYRRDVVNNIPIFALKSVSAIGATVYIKVPLNYISEYGTISEAVYTNRTLVIDLGKQPKDLVLEYCFNDILDTVRTRTGIAGEIKEVSLGDPQKVAREDHEIRETIRLNSVTVKKTKAIELAEITHRYNQLVQRIDDLGISLA